MDRIRDGRRGGVSVGGGPPPPRRRLRSNGGGGGGPRDSPRSERRRGERLMLNGGGGGAGRDDGDDTSDDSLGDDDDDAEEELAPRYQPSQQRRSPSTAPPPPSPPQHGGGGHHHSSSSSGGGGGGGYHSHHHHHHGQPHQMQRKGGPSQKSPIVLKAADEMIGVPVPRKARSASTKRSSHEWPVPGGGSGGGGGGGSGAGDSGSQIQRPSSRPISPASASTTAPARKKLKPLGGSGSSIGSGPAAKQRPSPSPAPSTTPPQPPPPKMSKSSSFIQEEIEVAEVLFGLTRQFPGPPKQENNHKLEHRDPPDTKSGNSSPAPSTSGVRPPDSSSLATIAPKRKRPRLVKYDEDSRPASPAKPETAEPSSRPEAPAVARSEAKASTSAAAESGASTTPASAQIDAPREAGKTEEDRGRSRDSELRASESDRRDHRPPESRPEPPSAPSVKPDGEATLVGSEAARNGEATATTKIELASDGSRQEKFCIDLMAPPPGKLSPDRDGASDPDADKKGRDSEMDMSVRVNAEKKDGERTRRGLDIDLEDHKVQRIPADEHAPRKFTLQLDLEKPSIGDEKSPSERRQPHPPPSQQQQHQKPSKSEIKHEKSAMPAVTPPMPLPVGGWLGSFPPFGYLGPVPALSAAGLHPMDVKPGSSSGLPQAALIPPPPTRSKRCATHCFVAQLIQYHQRIAKMNSFWPPAAAAAAAAANRSGPFFGPRQFNMGVVPPTDAASLLVNPMQGSYPVRAHTPLQESKAQTMASSPFQAGLAKDKAALGNAAGAESSQRKQPPAHETQQSTPMPNMLQGPAFIFPFNQQQAAAMAAASAASRAGDAKSSGASNAMQPPANAHATANPGAAAMNLSFANLQPADAQFLAILQNGAYPFQVAAHAGGPPSYRGMAPPGSAVPYFNGHVYPSHMLHPSQQQGTQQQSHQKNPMPSMSNSSQKHQPQSQGLLGYAPNANPPSVAAANNSQNYSGGNQRSALLPGLTHRQDSDKTGHDGQSSDDKSSHPQKGGYDQNFAVPVHLPNFAFAAQAAGNQNEKKLSDHHSQQQQQQANRGQGVRIDLASSQPFVMPFGNIGPPGSASTGLDFSSLAQSHAMFQSHQEAARHGYPQFNFAAAQSAQATQHKSQHPITGETKSVAGDSSSTPSAGDNERKKSASTKYQGDSQQHSLSFSRTENKSYGPSFLGGTNNENSSRTLSLIGAESPNAFGSKSSSSTTPTSAAAAASSNISQMQHQQQQHFLQIHQKNQQQFMQQHHLNRPRSAAPSTPGGAGGYQDRMNMANFQSMMYPSGAGQGGAPPGQSPQLKASSARVTASSAAGTAPATPPPNLIVMKNSGLQPKGPMQALSSPGHQSSSISLGSSKLGPSVTNISTGGGGDLSRSSNAPVASGSPSNSVSKSTGGSPPATGSAKGVQQSVQLSSPQQQSAKNPASTSGSKSTPTSHYNMPMPSILGQQPNVSPASNPGSKQQQSHAPPSSMKQQPFQGHFFISNNFAPQAPGPGGGLYPKQRSGDKTQQQVPHQQNAMSAASNNMKALHPPSGSFMHLATAAQSAGGVPHSHMSAQLTFGAMSLPVKPSSDQKPAGGK